jgi:hypothetical protein
VTEILQRRIEENRRKVDGLLRLQQRMEQALAHWKDMPDGMPDGHTICTVCTLIESVDEGRGQPLVYSGKRQTTNAEVSEDGKT